MKAVQLEPSLWPRRKPRHLDGSHALPDAVLVVPNHWGRAFHICPGLLTVDHGQNPGIFDSIEEAFAWAANRGHQVAVALERKRWA